MSSTNQVIADKFREVADLLEQQGANPFRVSAYRRAAATLVGLEEDVAAILDRDGPSGLEALPGIGRSLASAIVEMVRSGRWSRLERLRGSLDPEKVFRSIPGVGPELARRIHDELGVDTLEALEVAAHDGRLESVPGVGPRRAAMIRAALARMLARPRPSRPPGAGAGEAPPVGLILDVDAEYRRRAARGELRRIAPRRFNPSGEAWLPVLHTQRGPWHFTALYSNTARAHELGRTGDWVVVYYYTDNEPEGQCTVVTETWGPLAGRRVVRGREGECRVFYRAGAAAAS